MGNDTSRHQQQKQATNGGGKHPPPPPPQPQPQRSPCMPCIPCSFFGNDVSHILKRVVSGTTRDSDPMGTPMPDTPIQVRKLRERLLESSNNNNNNKSGGGDNSNINNNNNHRPTGGVFSSRYGGLEKEVSTDTGTGFVNINGAYLIPPPPPPPPPPAPMFGSGMYSNNNNNNRASAAASAAAGGGGGDNNDNGDAPIHEGPDCEKLLHQKYQLGEAMGVGSTSTVHRCFLKQQQNNSNSNQQNPPPQEYACKIIDCQLIEERFHGMLAQFQREIEALRQLNHPGIIRLYDVYMTPQKIYIVMELMEGGELFDYVVQKGTLTEEEASKIVRKVTSALVYMHDKNIVHRDLKPENLLLKKKPSNPKDTTTAVDVKIIDFGLSKAMEEPVARTFLGTRGYLAPEMLQRRDYTKAVDTWSLGVIVFVLLCGCLPFDDDSAMVPSDDLVRAKFVLRFPRWAKNLSASAKDLLSHLLDVNPMTRYTADQALAHPWVRGDTASRANLLASPKRIRPSPRMRSPAITRRPVGGGGGCVTNTRKIQTPDTPPTPQPVRVRKKSI